MPKCSDELQTMCQAGVSVSLLCSILSARLICGVPHPAPRCQQFRVNIFTSVSRQDDVENIFVSASTSGVLAAEISRLTGNTVEVVAGDSAQALRAARETCGARRASAPPKKKPGKGKGKGKGKGPRKQLRPPRPPLPMPM